MKKCSIEDCDNIHEAKGLCRKHYQRTLQREDANDGYYDRNKNPLYGTWRQMNQRCSNPNHRYYSYYGERGIKVCERWQGKEGFVNFLSDMGTKPDGMTLDRMDNSQGYSPENCTWATRTTQQINRRVQSNNTSEHKGVHLFKATGRWECYIDYKGKRKHLGFYKTKEEAIFARMAAELERDKIT